MSELKEFDVGLGQYCEDGSPCVVAVDSDKNPRILNEKVYLKSEVDKVIADKDAKILSLDAEVFKQKHHANMFFDERNYAENQLRHHKYKRCLDKAKWCEERCARYDLLQEHSGFSWRREIDFYFRWYQRWLELADKFNDKEAK